MESDNLINFPQTNNNHFSEFWDDSVNLIG